MRKKGKAEVPTAAWITDVMSIMVETCRSCNEAVRVMIARVLGSTIGEIMSEVLKIEEISNDPELYAK